jgi:hypothetical protein
MHQRDCSYCYNDPKDFQLGLDRETGRYPMYFFQKFCRITETNTAFTRRWGDVFIMLLFLVILYFALQPHRSFLIIRDTTDSFHLKLTFPHH